MSKRGDDTWIQTYTGRQVWPLDLHIDDLCIEDIAHALALKCRYTGHCREFYSIAQHSVLCSGVVLEPQLRLTALLHDASEAYLADLARPIKKSLPEFMALEDKAERIIADKFKLIYPFPPEVKRADNILLATERRDLMATPPRPWKTYGVEPLPERILPWPWDHAEAEFLIAFDDLTQEPTACST